MRFRFIGDYPAGRPTISYGGVTWYDRGSAEVTDPDWIRRLTNSIEFETVEDTAKAPKAADKPSLGDVAALRAAYVEKFGKKPWNGWDEATLREKMAAV